MTSDATTSGGEPEPAEAPPPAAIETDLAAEQVDDLFRDLSLCASMQHISVKYASDVRPEDRSTLLEGIDLVKARHLLDLPTTRAVQLRYEFEDALYVDTVTRLDPQGFHLLRVQHLS